MKGYFFFILVIMVTFSGYIFIGRPGDFQLSLNLSSNESAPVSKIPPYLTYITGDVLINAGAQSYRAEPFQTLRIGDEIFTLVNGQAILNMGPDQSVLIESGTKVTIKGVPKRKRGFTDLLVTKGKVLIDFFEGKDPVGVRVEVPSAYVLTPNASFRVLVSKEDSKIAVDRETIIVKRKNSSEETALMPGMGALPDQIPMVTGNFPWVDSFNWDQAYNKLPLRGIGVVSTLKAPLLRDRTPEVNMAALRPKREREQNPSRIRGTASVSHSAPSPTGERKRPKKGMGKEALNVLSKIPILGKNITESTDTIQDFEKGQVDRTKALDNLDGE